MNYATALLVVDCIQVILLVLIWFSLKDIRWEEYYYIDED